MRVGGQRHVPAALPPGITRYPLYRRLGGHQRRSGRLRKILPPPGFDPWTVQPVAIPYTDWDIPARNTYYVVVISADEFQNVRSSKIFFVLGISL